MTEPLYIAHSVLGPVTVTRPDSDRLEYLQERARVRKQVSSCTECPLWDRHNGPVPGEVPTHRPLLCVVGEAPGLAEDRKRTPLIGKAGKLLRKALADQGFPLEEVAFINTVSCLPCDEGRHHNRPRQPNKSETSSCRRNLFDQLEAIGAPYVLLCGIHALHSFRPDLKLNRHHGKLYVWQAQFLVLSTYHPASVTRGNRESKDAFYDDIATLRQLVKGDLSPEHLVSGWCSVCDEPAEKYDPNLVGYCPEHWKGNEKNWHQSQYEGQVLHGKGAMMETELFPDIPRVDKKPKGRIR